MSRWPRTTFQKQREQENANRAYHLATRRKDHEFLRETLREDASLHIFCVPLEQSLARTTGSGRVVGNPESAGINRHVVGDERALQGRKSLPLRGARVLRIRWFDPIAEASELPDHFRSAPLLRLFGDGWASFFV